MTGPVRHINEPVFRDFLSTKIKGRQIRIPFGVNVKDKIVWGNEGEHHNHMLQRMPRQRFKHLGRVTRESDYARVCLKSLTFEDDYPQVPDEHAEAIEAIIREHHPQLMILPRE